MSEDQVDQAQSITFTITKEGNLLFPWWNPLAQEIIDAVDGKIVDESSPLCG